MAGSRQPSWMWDAVTFGSACFTTGFCLNGLLASAGELETSSAVLASAAAEFGTVDADALGGAVVARIDSCVAAD